MTYDEELAWRVREQVADLDVTERAMFGGLAFLLGGHMSVAVSGRGGLMVRVGERNDQALREPHTEQVAMRGRPMTGWIRVAPEGLVTDEELGSWVQRGVATASALAPKR
jgi:TfoX/Sxy family transcriptional regulator of competence genes